MTCQLVSFGGRVLRPRTCSTSAPFASHAAPQATTSGRHTCAGTPRGRCTIAVPSWTRDIQPSSRMQCASSSDASIQPERTPEITPEVPSTGQRNVWIFAAALLLATIGSLCIPSVWAKVTGTAAGSNMGFIEGFSLIFMSELGDKTFFIAALLAMKVGKAVSFFGSTAALTVMTVISVSIGVMCAQVPAFIHSSIPVGEYLGAALLVFFGVKSIMAGISGDATGTGAELADAEESMDAAEKTGKKYSDFWGVASLIFVAEWGDRSMLATIALAIQNPPLAVGIGATLAHAMATLIAVIGGSVASKYISERSVNLIGGALFLVFAVLTLLGYA